MVWRRDPITVQFSYDSIGMNVRVNYKIITIIKILILVFVHSLKLFIVLYKN